MTSRNFPPTGRSMRWTVPALLMVLFTVVAPAVYAVPVTLTIVTLEAETGDTIATRIAIVDSSLKERYPIPMEIGFYHTANGGYHYAAGSTTVILPRGPAEIRLSRGFEYTPIVDTADIQSDTTIAYSLPRWIDMNNLGWYSGDSHVHLNHPGGTYIIDPSEGHMMAGAEGLNVANCLDQEWFFSGGIDPASTPDRIVYMSEEYRSSSYGHYCLIGLSSLVSPWGSIWYPLGTDAADSVHAQPGALIIAAHPITTDSTEQTGVWPGSGLARGLPMDVIGGAIDGFDLFSYSNFVGGGIETDLWYKLLNCGFHLPVSAGTDAAMNREQDLPLGGYKVYVDLEGSTFDFWAWCDQLARGRTFVTNGPLITTFTVDNVLAGDSTNHIGPGPLAVTGSLSVRSEVPLDRAEIVMNGNVVKTILFGGSGTLDTSFALNVNGSAWIAARVYGESVDWHTIGDTLFAHTGPVYVSMNDVRNVNPSDAQDFVAWIDDLEALVLSQGSWAAPADSAWVRAEIDAGRAFYQNLIVATGIGNDSGAEGTETAVRFADLSRTPNPYSATSGVLQLEIGNSGAPIPVIVEMYDLRGRRVRRLVDGDLQPGWHRIPWDGRDDSGRILASGVYFARIVSEEKYLTRKMILVR